MRSFLLMIEFRHKSNAELIAEGRRYHKNPNSKCACGLCVYSHLFAAQTALMCGCANPKWVHFYEVNLFPVGTFCSQCGDLHYTSLATNTFECEGCGRFGSHDYRQFLPPVPYNPSSRIKFPLSVNLCRRCNVSAPSAPSGTRRGFRIN